MLREVIQPISEPQRRQVIAVTLEYVSRACDIYGRSFEPIAVVFDLTGRAAGMYQLKRGQRRIRYNPYLFAKYFADNLAVTVPHEVAHYVTDMLHTPMRVRPHGPQWQAVMRDFGADARATCQYDLTGIPVRRQRRYPYRCSCAVHELSTRRHNQVRAGDVRCVCRNCGGELIYEE